MNQCRRGFLKQIGGAVASLALPGLSLAAEEHDVPWLAEVQQSPVNPRLANTGYLEPLLVAADTSPITTAAQWQKHRETIRRRWLEFLGKMPERPEVKLIVLSEDRPEGCHRQLVRYESERGLPVEAYLLRPEPLGKNQRAALVVLHQTSSNNIDEVAGVNGPDAQALGLKLARQGFVVFCPRCYLWQDVRSYDEAVANHRRRHPETLGMHKMLYDSQRGIDVLASLPEVDPQRIGATGHSLGAKETLYLAAFDERIRAAVASEGGIGLTFSNWNAPWYLGPGIQAADFRLNHHQLLALIAPRPFLILAGEMGPPAPSSDDGDRTWPFIEAVLPVYRLYGKPARIGTYNHRQGHTIPAKAFERMSEWLGTYLMKTA